MRTLLSHLAIVLSALTLGCATNGRPPTKVEEKGVRITYLVYSGRPNPSVVLDEDEARRVIPPLYEATRDAERSDAPHPILGYNGILIENLSVPSLPPRLHVSAGRVDVGDGVPSVRSDPERKLERTLLDVGAEKGALHPEVRKMIGL
jgi:hypothetical protein